MSFFSLFDNFDSISMVIIALIVFVIIFLICLSSSLIKKNKMLKEELKVREYNNDKESIISDNIDILNDNDINDNDNDNINNNVDNELNNNNNKNDNENNELNDNDISYNINNDILNELKERPYEEDSLSLEEEEDINEILSNIPDKDNVEVMPYAKNVLRNLSASGQTSPVNIGKSAVDVPKVKVTSYVKKEDKKDNELIFQGAKIDSNSNELSYSNSNSNSNNDVNNGSNQDYINEIKERLERENEPQTIELTDYERKQEEEAIISYRELVKVKDRLYNITDDEEIETFIDELKEFKEDLRKDS